LEKTITLARIAVIRANEKGIPLKEPINRKTIKEIGVNTTHEESSFKK